MKRRRVIMVAAAVAIAAGSASLAGMSAAGGAAVRLPAAGGTWGQAITVPGLAALNAGGSAGVNAVSCGSAGSCEAGGFYRDRSRHFQAFVASERNGRWEVAVEVPGSGALNKGGNAQITSVSCASAGNCAAGGYYSQSGNHAFVVGERNGHWGKAIEVVLRPGPVRGGPAQVLSVSCAAAGECAAGGYFRRPASGGFRFEAFVATERNGRWGTAVSVAGLGYLNSVPGGRSEVSSVSCASAGDCSAVGGSYLGLNHGFAVSERNGRWGTALELRGDLQVRSVSCASADTCTAAGSYARSGRAFVVSERNGRWGKPFAVPGLTALNGAGRAGVMVSCPSAGDCVGGGFYVDRSGRGQAFVVSERNGHWGHAIEVPGSGALNAGGSAEVEVSCPSAGNCAGGGFYTDASDHWQALVVSERNGHWGHAIEVPGSGTLNTGGTAQLLSVSCASAGNCAAGGLYTAGTGRHEAFQGFVVTEK